MPDFIARLEGILARTTPTLPQEELRLYVAGHYRKREKLLQLWEENGRRPLYLFDEQALLRRAREFRAAFQARFSDVGFYYAMKSNNHPFVAQTLASNGFGIDVSSGIELQIALQTDADHIVFSGPGKLDEELQQAVEQSDRLTVLIDSFGELDRLSRLAVTRGVIIRAGVRLNPPGPHGWRKFGVALGRLRSFWETAAECPGVVLQGIQFHTSWNMDSGAQTATIAALGREIASWPSALSSRIRFLDIGGGYWPPAGEWLLPEGTEAGRLRQILGEAPDDRAVHLRNPAVGIEEAAACLFKAVESEIFPTTRCRVCFEPGRWISNEAMHILISVVDKKEADLVITDAGTNAIGWERFEQDYAPVLNLSRPDTAEIPCHILGSLCTPHDMWGYSYFGSGIERGDVLLIPDQGAYTYSLRQNFIKAIPDIVRMMDEPGDREHCSLPR